MKQTMHFYACLVKNEEALFACTTAHIHGLVAVMPLDLENRHIPVIGSSHDVSVAASALA